MLGTSGETTVDINQIILVLGELTFCPSGRSEDWSGAWYLSIPGLAPDNSGYWMGTWGKTSWRNHIYYHSVGEGAWRVDMLKKTPCGAVRSLVRCSGDTRPTASCGPLAHCGPLPRQKHSKTAFLHFSTRSQTRLEKKWNETEAFVNRRRLGPSFERIY